MLYDSVPNVLSELIRTAFVAREGNKFAVADFSAIEARVYLGLQVRHGGRKFLLIMVISTVHRLPQCLVYRWKSMVRIRI